MTANKPGRPRKPEGPRKVVSLSISGLRFAEFKQLLGKDYDEQMVLDHLRNVAYLSLYKEQDDLQHDSSNLTGDTDYQDAQPFTRLDRPLTGYIDRLGGEADVYIDGRKIGNGKK